MSLLHRARVRRWLSAHLLCEVPQAGPRFALTFDDGPSPRNTPALLDVLARHGAQATFFVMAGRARRHAELVRRTLAGGHEIGVHGALHLPAWMLPRPWFDRELSAAMASVTTVIGCPPRLYRAPFGLLWPAQARWARDLGLTPVLGSVYPQDHAERSGDPIVTRVLPRLEPGAIIILHDSSALGDADRRPTIEAVDRILVDASRRGLRATTVREMIAQR